MRRLRYQTLAVAVPLGAAALASAGVVQPPSYASKANLRALGHQFVSVSACHGSGSAVTGAGGASQDELKKQVSLGLDSLAFDLFLFLSYKLGSGWI
jgi:hypothetical protein